jgi:hypothetical protein
MDYQPAAKKRIGRPFKVAKKKQRVSLGLKVRAEVKTMIDKAAKDSGRTQSQEAEALIERALAYDSAFKAMNITTEQIAKGKVEAACHSAGYVSIILGDGRKAWVYEPDPTKRSGFKSEAEQADETKREAKRA